MGNLDGFNANEVEPSKDFEPIPEGRYTAVITESEMMNTKAGNGSYLKLTFQIVEGQHQNRNLWARLNLDNPNEKAVQIAKGQLSAICRAVGVLTPKDSAELHNLPLVIRVTCQPDDDGFTRNEVKGFYTRASAQAVAETPAPVRPIQKAVPQQAAKATWRVAPWAKGK